LVILLLTSFSVFAEDKICFSAETARDMIVELDQCRIVNDILVEIKKENIEQMKIIESLKEKEILTSEKIDISERTIKEQKQLINDAQKICDQRVKDAKPSLQNEILKAFGIIVVGIVIGLIL